MGVRNSAGWLPYRIDPEQGLLVFIAHMGGPFWAHKDDGGWSIAKGEYDADAEDPQAAARREFAEEIGVPAPDGQVLDLGVHRQPRGKLIHAFAVPAAESLRFVASNEFELEWPKGSGVVRGFPEIDRAQWFTLEVARRKVVGGQVAILDALAAAVAGGEPQPMG